MREDCDRLATIIAAAGYPAAEPGCPVDEVLRLAAECIEGLKSERFWLKREVERMKRESATLFEAAIKKGKKHG